MRIFKNGDGSLTKYWDVGDYARVVVGRNYGYWGKVIRVAYPNSSATYILIQYAPGKDIAVTSLMIHLCNDKGELLDPAVAGKPLIFRPDRTEERMARLFPVAKDIGFL